MGMVARCLSESNFWCERGFLDSLSWSWLHGVHPISTLSMHERDFLGLSQWVYMDDCEELYVFERSKFDGAQHCCTINVVHKYMLKST